MKAKAMMGKRMAVLLVDIVTTSTIITYFSQKGKLHVVAGTPSLAKRKTILKTKFPPQDWGVRGAAEQLRCFVLAQIAEK